MSYEETIESRMGGSSSRSVRPLVQGQCAKSTACTDIVNDGSPGDPATFNRQDRDTTGFGPTYPGDPLPHDAFACRSYVRRDGSVVSSCHIDDPCYAQVCDVQGRPGEAQVFTQKPWKDLVRWNLYQNRSDVATCTDTSGNGGTPVELDGTRHKGCLGTSYDDDDARIATHDVSRETCGADGTCAAGGSAAGTTCRVDADCRVAACQEHCLDNASCVAASLTRKDFDAYQQGQRQTMRDFVAAAGASAVANLFAPGITAGILAGGYAAAKNVGPVKYIDNTQCHLYDSFDESKLRHCGCDDGGIAGATGKGCGGLIPGDTALQCGALTMRPVQFVCANQQGVDGYMCQRPDGSIAARGDRPDHSFSLNRCDKLKYYNDSARDTRMEAKCCAQACTESGAVCRPMQMAGAANRMRTTTTCHPGADGDFKVVDIVGDLRGPITSAEATMGMNMDGARADDGELAPTNQLKSEWKVADARTAQRDLPRHGPQGPLQPRRLDVLLQRCQLPKQLLPAPWPPGAGWSPRKCEDRGAPTASSPCACTPVTCFRRCRSSGQPRRHRRRLSIHARVQQRRLQGEGWDARGRQCHRQGMAAENI